MKINQHNTTTTNFLLLIFSELCYCNHDGLESVTNVLSIFEPCTFHSFLHSDSFSPIAPPTAVNPVIMEDVGKLTDNKTQILVNNVFYLVVAESQHYEPNNQSKSVITRIPTKFQNCLVVVIDVSWMPQSIRGASILKNKLLKTTINGMIFLKRDPDYIILQDRITKKPDLAYFLTQTLPFISVTSKFILIFIQLQKSRPFLYKPNIMKMCIFAICVTCLGSKNFKNMMTPIPSYHTAPNSYKFLAKWWINLHKNLHALPIRQSGMLRPKLVCSSYNTGLGFSEASCVASILGQHYNIGIPKNESDNKYGMAINNYIINQQFVETNFLQKSTFRISWINYGCTYNRFNFRIFSVPSSGNYAVLLLPFDIVTWIILFISAAIVSGILILATKGMVHNKGISILFWTITTLLDQSNRIIYFHHVKHGNGKYASLLGGWLISAYFLGNLYKGAMYSCLTSFSVPSTPSNLQGLMSLDIPILTTSTHRQMRNETLHMVSTLNHLVITELMHALDKKYRLYKILQQIQNTSISVWMRGYEMSKSISEGKLINSSSGESFLVPDNFAVLDADSDLNLLTSAIRLFPKYLPILHNAVSFYTVLTPWLVQRNFFAPIFADGISRLVESGIYHWWGENYWDVNLLVEIEQLKGVNNISREFAKIMFGKGMKSSFFSNADSVSFQKLKVPFVICLIFMGVGLISFAIEYGSKGTINTDNGKVGKQLILETAITNQKAWFF